MQKLQSQGVHHITLVGADRKTSIDFWQGTLGMPFVFEQPNLDDPSESHLYFEPGDGRLITVFCDERRPAIHTRVPGRVGTVHHIAFAVSQVTLMQAAKRLKARGIGYTGPKDRGFMHSIYFREPLGLLIELASWTFVPPQGSSHAEVLAEAHRLRVLAGDAAIATEHVAQAVEAIVARNAAIAPTEMPDQLPSQESEAQD